LKHKQEDTIQEKGLFIWTIFSEFWPEYFELMGVFFIAYALVRLAIGWEFRMRPPRDPDWDGMKPGTGIDASKLSDRMEQLREAGYTRAVDKPSSFKKPLLVEEKRQEIGKLPFFQKTPAPEMPPPEHEDGMGLMLI
jgi:hypothetical protein